jgi:hypothetical protein
MLKSFASSPGGVRCDEGLSTQFEIRKQEKNSQYYEEKKRSLFAKTAAGKT